MSPKPKVGDQPINVRLPRDLHFALLDRAAAEERAMAATVRVAIRYYLANTEPPVSDRVLSGLDKP